MLQHCREQSEDGADGHGQHCQIRPSQHLGQGARVVSDNPLVSRSLRQRLLQHTRPIHSGNADGLFPQSKGQRPPDET
jgi:hypothetical protein